MAAPLLAAAWLAMSAGAAAAHISITPAEAQPGANVTFSVRVPTEQESATIRVRVDFPAGVTVSRFQPKPGWQRTVERDGSGRITSATWTGGQILNGEFDDFTFIARTPAEAGALRFRAFQTYAAGETVEWTKEGEPRPAPVVNVRAAAASTASDDHGQAVAPATGVAPAAATTQPSTGLGGAAAATRPASAGVTTLPGSQAAEVAGRGGDGSDLPLIVALGSGVLALVSLAVAALALMRRPGELGSAGNGGAG